MPASDRFTPTDPLRYLVHGTKMANERNTVQENQRAVSGWIYPELLGGYIAPPAPKSAPRYRLHLNTNSLEIDGFIDVASATTGDLAFILVRAMWRPYDVSYATHLINEGVYTPAHVSIDSTNGEVILYWE